MSDFIQSLTRKPEYDSDEIIVQKIDIDLIRPDKGQVRGTFDEDKIEELADSIKAKGLLNPIHVRLVNDEYVILTGERRFRACRVAGVESIPCIVHAEDLNDSEIRSLQLIENLQRQNLSVLETARAFDKLIQDGMKKRQIAVNLGISETTVSKYTSILTKIPEEWLETIEKTSKDVGLNDLYAVAKEKNKTRKTMSFRKLIEQLGEQISLEIEEKEAAKREKKETPSQFTDEELTIAWEALIKEKRKNIQNILQYITAKKIQTLMETKEE